MKDTYYAPVLNNQVANQYVADENLLRIDFLNKLFLF